MFNGPYPKPAAVASPGPTPYYIAVCLTNNATLVSGTALQVPFNFTRDSLNMDLNGDGSVNIYSSGLYCVNFGGQITTIVSGLTTYGLFRNGLTLLLQFSESMASFGSSFDSGGLVNLTAGDTVSVQALQSSGVAKSLAGNVLLTYLHLYKILQ